MMDLILNPSAMKILSHSPLTASYIKCQQRERTVFYYGRAANMPLFHSYEIVLLSCVFISSLLSNLARKYIRRMPSLEPSQLIVHCLLRWLLGCHEMWHKDTNWTFLLKEVVALAAFIQWPVFSVCYGCPENAPYV